MSMARTTMGVSCWVPSTAASKRLEARPASPSSLLMNALVLSCCRSSLATSSLALRLMLLFLQLHSSLAELLLVPARSARR